MSTPPTLSTNSRFALEYCAPSPHRKVPLGTSHILEARDPPRMSTPRLRLRRVHLGHLLLQCFTRAHRLERRNIALEESQARHARGRTARLPCRLTSSRGPRSWPPGCTSRPSFSAFLPASCTAPPAPPSGRPASRSSSTAAASAS